jgi:hypothetical protein
LPNPPFPGGLPLPPLPPISTPSVYIQHLATPEMATSFADTYHTATGRSLQYVTSINSLQQLPTALAAGGYQHPGAAAAAAAQVGRSQN